jgi:hypothetical protein
MSTRSKITVAACLLIVALSTNAVSAAPQRASATDGVLGKIERIVKQIRKILLPNPLDDPSFPKP